MNQHVTTASVLPFRRPLEAMSRDEIVKIMAEHLVAEIMHGSLNTANSIDVIECLLKTPDRFQSAVVRNHMDAALISAKRILDEMYGARQERIQQEMGTDR